MNAFVADRVRTSGALLGPWLRTLDGIGAERASRLLARFGDDIINALSDTRRSREVSEALSPGRPHLGEKLAALVQAKFAGSRSSESVALKEAEFYALLELHGVDNRASARALYRLVGCADAWARLLAHPYSAAAVLTWKQADHFGQKLLRNHDKVLDPGRHPSRLMGACDAAWKIVMAAGHTACIHKDFLAILKRLGVPPAEALEAGIAGRRVLVQHDRLRAPGATWMEREVAVGLGRLSTPCAVQDWNFVLRYGIGTGGRLTLEQRNAVLAILGRPISVLQGGAGTGKTTTMRILVDAWVARGGNAVLAALAGKAALKLSKSTGQIAFTLARLVHGLERRRKLQSENRFVPEELPNIDAVTMLVVDESSMVDLATWRRVVGFMPDGSRLVMVGDVAQLPPVGLGRVFHDLVEDGRVVSVLTKTLRQAAGNPLIVAATAVRDGYVPDVPDYVGIAPGVFMLESKEAGIEAELGRVRQDFADASTGQGEFLVLAGLNRTARRFCAAMQNQRFQAGVQGIRLGPLAPFVSVGDPVVVSRNRYDESLMNGLMGWVVDIDAPTFQFDGEDIPRSITRDAMSELISAWAITCHRAQGSETRRVVVALDGKEGLTREWLYTAITRATDQVVLVGTRESLAAGVARLGSRVTGFSAELTTCALGRSFP